jgi:hypothetical protein
VEAARAHAIAVARELSGNRVPDHLVGRQISVVDELGPAEETAAGFCARYAEGRPPSERLLHPTLTS